MAWNWLEIIKLIRLSLNANHLWNWIQILEIHFCFFNYCWRRVSLYFMIYWVWLILYKLYSITHLFYRTEVYVSTGGSSIWRFEVARISRISNIIVQFINSFQRLWWRKLVLLKHYESYYMIPKEWDTVFQNWAREKP